MFVAKHAKSEENCPESGNRRFSQKISQVWINKHLLKFCQLWINEHTENDVCVAVKTREDATNKLNFFKKFGQYNTPTVQKKMSRCNRQEKKS